MKCPKCNYTSYDGLTSCKKCGYVFKNGSDFKSKASFMPSVSGTKTEREEIAKSKRPPDVSETVASIKASLDEIEAGETESAESSVKEQIDEMESNTIQNEKDDKSIEGGREFPAFDEINWDESVSLSNDGLTFNIDELAGGEKEIGLEEKKSDMSDTKEKKRKEELAKIGEELKQIEEEPEQVETIYPSEYHDTGFDLSKMRKGGFWIRFIAYTIDSVILNILGLILMRIGLAAFGLGSSGLEELEVEEIVGVIVPYLIFMVIINVAYFTYFHGSVGQTPGKMVFKLKVVRVNGEPLGYGKAFLRWVGYIVSSIFYLGFLWAAWDMNKQAWHDKIAGTYVIRL